MGKNNLTPHRLNQAREEETAVSLTLGEEMCDYSL